MTLTPSKVNQGAPGPNANAWPVSVQSIGAGLALPIVGSAPAQSSATWTSATALNTALTYTGLAPYGAVTIGITTPTTATAGAVTIETSLDGTNWTQAGSVRVDNSQVENVVPLAYWPGTNGTRQYLVSLDALAQVRVRLSTVITGAGNTTVIIAPAQQGVEPFVATRSRKVATYRALYRTTTRAYGLSNTFGAAGRKQFATIYHAASATRTVRLRRVQAALDTNTVASGDVIDLVRLTATTAPATGNPTITPARLDTSDPTAEATCLALPTTAGSESTTEFFGEAYFNIGISGAAPTSIPPPVTPAQDIYVASPGDDEGRMPTIRAGVAEGFAVCVDVGVATTVRVGWVLIEFTEEVP